MNNNNDIKIGLIGYGAIGKQVERLLLQNGFDQNQLTYFDDKKDKETSEPYFGFWSFRESRFSDLYFIPTIGYLSMKLKRKVIEELKVKQLKMFSFVHPSSFVNPTAVIGGGVVVYPKCNIDQNVIIKDGVLLNNSCVISHDSTIGENCYLSPGVIISGFGVVGQNSFIGTGSIVSNHINIGENVKIGLATSVTRNLQAGAVAIGNPMKIKSKLKIL